MTADLLTMASDTSSTAGLGPNVATLLLLVHIHNKNKLDVDWDKVAECTTYKNRNSVQTRFQQILKKFASGDVGAEKKADGEKPVTEAKGKKRKAGESGKGRGKRAKKEDVKVEDKEEVVAKDEDDDGGKEVAVHGEGEGSETNGVTESAGFAVRILKEVDVEDGEVDEVDDDEEHGSDSEI